jgi:hypothetical protein
MYILRKHLLGSPSLVMSFVFISDCTITATLNSFDASQLSMTIVPIKGLSMYVSPDIKITSSVSQSNFCISYLVVGNNTEFPINRYV